MNNKITTYLFVPLCGLPLFGDCFGGLLLLPVPEGFPVVLGILEGLGLPGLIVVFAIFLKN